MEPKKQDWVKRAKLQNIWKSKQYTMKTKIKLHNSNVKSILLYGSEC